MAASGPTDRRTPDADLPTEALLARYLRSLSLLAAREEAREESRYPALKELVEAFASRRGRRPVEALLLPRVDGLCPDLQVAAGDGRIVGYVEAKLPGRDLRALEVSHRAQLDRYRGSFPNLLFTNFHEFVLFRGEAEAGRATLGSPELAALGAVPPAAGAAELAELLDRFLDFEALPSRSAETLARRLAHRTRHLRDMIAELLARDPEHRTDLGGFYRAFSRHLLAGLDHRRFADLYAQTLTFGLFAARTRVREGFDLRTAFDAIPATDGILRDAFRYISIADPPPEVRWIVEDLVEVLATADPHRLLSRRRRKGRRNPVFHFYETFLAAYDPEERERRGVFYTPEEVVSYIVRSVDELLHTRFGKPTGLADPSVSVLDPAAGTLTFIVRAFEEALRSFAAVYGDGDPGPLLRDHLLVRFHAFELMMAPYAVGHLKIGYLLEELGYPLGPEERFKLYLTDALEIEELAQTTLPGMASLSRESHEAARVKLELPALVVMGNPPYRGHSANHGRWIDELLRHGYRRADGGRDDGYYRAGGRPLGERNPKWLQDDYVKFLRFAQWKIDRTGQGIVAFVTNHGYLDNPTFRGLRESLLESFDQLYLLDLHGNSKRQERSPDGSRDENVFDIRQGVAVALFVKRPGLERGVFRADLWGSRKEKLRWLEEHERATTPWQRVEPHPPLNLFAPSHRELERSYQRFVPLSRLFPVRSAGVVSGRDAFALAFHRRELLERIDRFRQLQVRYRPEEEAMGLASSRSWDLEEARRRAAADSDWRDRVTDMLYRPFDVRAVFYADYLLERPRRAVMRHLLGGDNVALVVPRQGRDGDREGVAAALVTRFIAGHKAVSAYDVNSVFPLFLEPEAEGGTLPGPLFRHPGEASGRRRPNLAPDLVAALAAAWGREPAPEELLAYVYAVLWCPRYRRAYAPLLSLGFPRLPFPADPGLFGQLAHLGRRLVDLHLLRARELDPPTCRFHGEGPGTLAGSRRRLLDYRPAERRVVVNREGQSFDGIRPPVWEMRVGGWQVLPRWLADRRGRRLDLGERTWFCRLVTALARTLEIEADLDRLYPAVEAGPLEVPLREDHR